MEQEKQSLATCPKCSKVDYLKGRKCKHCGHELSEDELKTATVKGIPSSVDIDHSHIDRMEEERKRQIERNRYSPENPYSSNI